MNLIAPSMLSIDFGNVEKGIKTCVKAGADYIHVDVMDGNFVPNISFGPPVIRAVKKAAGNVPLDVHVMMLEPIRFIEPLKKAGADMITVHYESASDINATLDAIKNAGLKVGVALKPKTPLDAILDLLDKVDMVLIMAVEPGFGGQVFIEDSYDKIRNLRNIINERKLDIDIEVDGGVREDNLQKVLDAGANVIVAGSAVFTGDIEENIKKFLSVMR